MQALQLSPCQQQSNKGQRGQGEGQQGDSFVAAAAQTEDRQRKRGDGMACRGLMELFPLNHIPVGELTNSVSTMLNPPSCVSRTLSSAGAHPWLGQGVKGKDVSI